MRWHRIITSRFQTIRGPSWGGPRYRDVTSRRLSITASPQATQSEILGQLNEHMRTAIEHAPSKPLKNTVLENSLIVLATKDFTSWIDDEKFMSEFLKLLLKPRYANQPNFSDLHVLSGIVDGLSPRQLCGEPRSGFSVLRGSVDYTLPRLWIDDLAGLSQDTPAAISFVTTPFAENTGVLNVTLPLANTVFQNGRRSTLYASRWNIDGGGSITLHTRQPKTAQRIVPKDLFRSYTSPVMPLLPLTTPRKIIAGLGNIVRQIDFNGAVKPASMELEDAVPKLFKERAQRDPYYSPEPIGVWCWVIPPHLMKKFDELKLFKELKPFEQGDSRTETNVAMETMDVFSKLLSSGCRLQKILSGGGGWGEKKGLLSLDPETVFSLPGQEDNGLEMFIKSFEARNSSKSSTDNISLPGSYIFFCTEPQMKITNRLRDELLLSVDQGLLSENQALVPEEKTFVFGVAPNLDDSTMTPHSTSDTIQIINEHFGISSAGGVFLRSSPEPSRSIRENEKSFTTKIDVPGAYMCA